MGHKGVSKRKPKQLSVPPAPDATPSGGRGLVKDALQTTPQASKPVEKTNAAGGPDKKRKKRG
jgi:hypothetical protein